MEELGGGADGGKVHRGNGSGGDRIGHAALEDQVHVHQAVAHNGIAEGERQKDQREHADLHRRRRPPAVEEGDDVENRERNDRQESAARNPLHLLAQNWRAGVQVGVPEHEGRGQEERRHVAHLHPVQVPEQQSAGLGCCYQQHPEAQQQQSRQIDQRQNPAPLLHERLALRKAQREVQKHRRLQHSRNHIGPVNRPVKLVQLAGEFEGVKDE